MLTLESEDLPLTADGWRGALAVALRRWVGAAVVGVDGELPELDRVSVDLTGGRIDAAARVDMSVLGATAAGPTVGAVGVRGEPLVVYGVPVVVDVSAADVAVATGRNAAGRVVVVLAGVGEGRVSAHVAHADLDAALLLAARAAAGPHGVEVQGVRSTLASRGLRAVDVELAVVAKKFVTFNLRIAGRVSVDDTMTATATGLRVDGTGMAAGFAAGVLRPQLQRAEGRRVPLMAFDLGGVRVRDVAVDVADGLRVTATFGGGTPPVAAVAP